MHFSKCQIVLICIQNWARCHQTQCFSPFDFLFTMAEQRASLSVICETNCSGFYLAVVLSLKIHPFHLILPLLRYHRSHILNMTAYAFSEHCSNWFILFVDWLFIFNYQFIDNISSCECSFTDTMQFNKQNSIYSRTKPIWIMMKDHFCAIY